MKAEVDKSGCIGCGLCASTCPEVFEMESDGTAGVIANPVADSDQAAAQEAADGCPVSVITIL